MRVHMENSLWRDAAHWTLERLRQMIASVYFAASVFRLADQAPAHSSLSQYGQGRKHPRISPVTWRGHLDDPLLRWSVLFALVPYLVMVIAQTAHSTTPSFEQVARRPVATATTATADRPTVSASRQSVASDVTPSAPVVATATPPHKQTAVVSYERWLAANRVVKDLDLTQAGTIDGQIPKRPLAGFRVMTVVDLAHAGAATGRVPTRPAEGIVRQRQVVDLTLGAEPSPARRAVTGVDLTHAGTPTGTVPRRVIAGERRGVVVDLQARGSAGTAPPRIPPRDD
jgi:hypothetical protein